MNDPASRIARVEARLDGHEDLCTERWRELRDGVSAMRSVQSSNHADNANRLSAIERRIAEVQGAGKLARWLTGGSLIGAGGLAVWLLKVLGILR